MTTTPFARKTGQPRNPARIDIVLAALRAYWTANPDLRTVKSPIARVLG